MNDAYWPPRLVWEIKPTNQLGSVKGSQLLEAILHAVLDLPRVTVLVLSCFQNSTELHLVEITSTTTSAPGSDQPTRYYVAGIDNRPLLIKGDERYRSVRLVLRGLLRDDPELLGPWREAKDLAERIEAQLAGQ